MIPKYFVPFIIASALASASIWMAAFDEVAVGWFFLMGAVITLIIFVRFVWGSWFNLSIIFTVFFGLYALSGPYEVIFGTGEIPPFDPPYQVSPWLIASSMALFGFLVGILAVRVATRVSRQTHFLRMHVNPALVGIGLVFLASVGEMINLFRAGGLSILLAGKSVSQGAISALSFTIPSPSLALLGFGFFGLFLGANHKQTPVKKYVFLLSLSSFPLVLIHLILGQRLHLASYILSFLLGLTYKKQIQRLPFRLVVGLLLLYLFAAPLYAFRWAFPLILRGESVPIDSTQAVRRVLSALNPAVNEFGSAFGNFNTYVSHGGGELKYGITYLRDLTTAIPGFVFLGEKPLSATYEFRNTYFPEWAIRSPIAGTAFSSVLEAYMNFGMIGIPFVFALYGIMLGVLEKLKLQSSSVYIGALYATFAKFALIIHRSSTGDVLSGYLWTSVWILTVYLIGTTWKGVGVRGG